MSFIRHFNPLNRNAETAAALITFMVFVAYSPLMFSRFAVGDDFAICAQFLEKGPHLLNAFTAGGRHILAVVSAGLFSFVDTMQDFAQIRVIGVGLTALIGCKIYRLLRQHDINLPISIVILGFGILQPGFAVWNTWAICSVYGLFALLSLNMATRLQAAPRSLPRQLQCVGVLIMLLFTYQPTVTFFLLPFILEASQPSITRETIKKLIRPVVVFCFANGLYAGVFYLWIRPTTTSSEDMFGRRSELTEAPISRLVEFFTEVLPDVTFGWFGLTFLSEMVIFPVLCAAALLLLVLALMSKKRLQWLLRIIIFSSSALLAVCHVLPLQTPFYYRTLPCLYLIVAFSLVLIIPEISRRRPGRVVFAIMSVSLLLQVFLTYQKTDRWLVRPHVEDVRFIESAFTESFPEYLPHRILIVCPEKQAPLAEEFGEHLTNFDAGVTHAFKFFANIHFPNSPTPFVLACEADFWFENAGLFPVKLVSGIDPMKTPEKAIRFPDSGTSWYATWAGYIYAYSPFETAGYIYHPLFGDCYLRLQEKTYHIDHPAAGSLSRYNPDSPWYFHHNSGQWLQLYASPYEPPVLYDANGHVWMRLQPFLR